MVEPLGRGEQAATGEHVRVAGPTRRVGQADVRPGPRRRREGPAGRDELDDAADLVAGLAEPGTHEPEAGPDATERGGHERLGPARLEEEHHPGIAGQPRLDRRERSTERGGLPAPWRTATGPEQRLERQQGGRLAPEEPAGREVGVGEAVLVGTLRRLADDEAHARTLDRAPDDLARLDLECPERRCGAEADDGGRDPLTQAADVVAEAGRSGPERVALQPLDEAADHAIAVLEGEPRVPFAPLVAGGQLDPAGVDPDVRDAAREAVEPARGEQRVKQRQPEGGLHRRRPQVRVDPFEDRLEAVELARRVEVEELVHELVVPVEGGEPLVQQVPGVAARVDRLGAVEIVLVDRRVTLLAAAELIAAHDAPVVLAGEPTTGRPLARRRADRTGRVAIAARHHAFPDIVPVAAITVVVALALGLPDELVDDGTPTARGTAGRERVADGHAQARLAARSGTECLERRVEMADVRRAQHDLGQEPGQWVRLHRDSAPLAVHGGASHPAAAPVQVDDHVTRRRMAVDRGGDQVRGRWRAEALERGKRDGRVGAGEWIAGDHVRALCHRRSRWSPIGAEFVARGRPRCGPALGVSRCGSSRGTTRCPRPRRARRALLRRPRPW